MFEAIMDYVLFLSCIFLLLGSMYITVKLNFIQFSLIPNIFKMFSQSLLHKQTNEQKDNQMILPHKALFTAMSTTLGISTIAGPAIAISLGGPGALIGFLFTSILGSAATFTEVNLCVKFRNKLPSGKIIGGPMEYLKILLSKKMATWYAVSCCILMTAWSGAQANQLAAIFDSPLLGDFRLSKEITGIIVAALVYAALFGGIKRISSLASKMVPLMFVLFLGSSLWIIFANIQLIPSLFTTIFSSAFTPYAMANGSLVGGAMSALRWGILKGTQTTEAGIGTQTIPHSMTNTEDARSQGALAMVSTYTAGFMGFLSGCVVLLTNTWQDPEIPMGISMIASSFYMYFSNIGLFIITFCSFLFAFGTSLGNSYNGSQCFIYLLGGKYIRYYFAFIALVIFISSISDVKTIWSMIDIFLVTMAIPHMFALMRYAQTEYKKEKTLVDLNE